MEAGLPRLEKNLKHKNNDEGRTTSQSILTTAPHKT